jgi:hypothetical protein
MCCGHQPEHKRSDRAGALERLCLAFPERMDATLRIQERLTAGRSLPTSRHSCYLSPARPGQLERDQAGLVRVRGGATMLGPHLVIRPSGQY